jgi:hypothetical protein
MMETESVPETVKGKIMVRRAQQHFICMVDSNRLHVSTLHAGHLQAFTKMSPETFFLLNIDAAAQPSKF